MKKKNIAILGSTGSIGKTTLNIIKKNKKEFNIFFLKAHLHLLILNCEFRKQYYRNSKKFNKKLK